MMYVHTATTPVRPATESVAMHAAFQKLVSNCKIDVHNNHAAGGANNVAGNPHRMAKTIRAIRPDGRDDIITF